MTIFKNKIINIDFVFTELLYRDIEQNDYEYTGFTIRDCIFNNCIFIGYNCLRYSFKICRLVNCTFYNFATINITSSCIVDNIVIIDNTDKKIRNLIAYINGLCTNITFKHCNFYSCEVSATTNNIQFIDCINEPGFYINDKSFYGYKYSNEGYLIVLEIPENAIVYASSNSEYDKYRCDRAKVVSILNMDGTYSGIKECTSWYDEDFKYTTGECIKVYLSRYYMECGNGIHFYQTLKDAYMFYKANIIYGRIL